MKTFKYTRYCSLLVYILTLASVLSLTPRAAAQSTDWQAIHKRTADMIITGQTPETLIERAVVALYNYDNTAAQMLFDQIAIDGPDTLTAQWGKAEILRRKHTLDQARTTLAALLEHEPTFSPAIASMGFLEYVEGNFSEAIAYAKTILKQSDKADTHSRTLAHILLSACFGIEAHSATYLRKLVLGPTILHHIHKADALMPKTADVLFATGVCYMLAPKFFFGDDTKARHLLEESKQKRPLFADAYIRLAQIERRNNNRGREKKLLTHAKRIDPKNELLLDYLSPSNLFITQE